VARIQKYEYVGRCPLAGLQETNSGSDHRRDAWRTLVPVVSTRKVTVN